MIVNKEGGENDSVHDCCGFHCSGMCRKEWCNHRYVGMSAMEGHPGESDEAFTAVRSVFDLTR